MLFSKWNEEGVVFRSYYDGKKIFLSPEISIKSQKEADTIKYDIIDNRKINLNYKYLFDNFIILLDRKTKNTKIIKLNDEFKYDLTCKCVSISSSEDALIFSTIINGKTYNLITNDKDIYTILENLNLNMIDVYENIFVFSDGKEYIIFTPKLDFIITVIGDNYYCNDMRIINLFLSHPNININKNF